MWKSLLIMSVFLTTLAMTGCKVQTVQQYEAEKDANAKVVVLDEQEKETTKTPVDTKKNSTEREKTNTSTNRIEATKKNVVVEETAEKETPQVNHPKSSATTNVPAKIEKNDQLVAAPEEDRRSLAINEQQKSVPKTTTPQKRVEKKQAPMSASTSDVKKEIQKTVDSNEPVQKATPIKTPPASPTEEQSNPVEQKKEYVTVSIGMKLLTNPINYAKLPEALQQEDYVPENGQIVSGTLAITEDTSAWDAILKLCQSRNIHLDYEYKAMFDGIYIKGINHVYEKDAGPTSGWMYAVNGKLAPVGVSQYTLEANDVITLEYSITGGSDLGW